MGLRNLSIAALAAALALSGSASALQINVGTPTPQTVQAGQITTIDVTLSGLPADLASVAFNLGYDPLLLEFDAFDPAAFGAPFSGTVDGQLSGLISVGAGLSAAANPALADPFPLITLAFRGIGLGPATVSVLTGVDLDPSAQVFGAGGDLVDFLTLPGATITAGPAATANVVPEPGTLLLLGTGLLGVVGCARRRRGA